MFLPTNVENGIFFFSFHPYCPPIIWFKVGQKSGFSWLFCKEIQTVMMQLCCNFPPYIFKKKKKKRGHRFRIHLCVSSRPWTWVFSWQRLTNIWRPATLQDELSASMARSWQQHVSRSMSYPRTASGCWYKTSSHSVRGRLHSAGYVPSLDIQTKTLSNHDADEYIHSFKRKLLYSSLFCVFFTAL